MAIKNIEPNLRLISEYLKLRTQERFAIPSYQRGYSWGTEQCDKLWQDIEDFIESKAEDPYFFGTIIIDCSQEDRCNLIDGQQRTTTFLLLLKALQLRIKDALKYLVRDDETEALEEGLKSSYNKIMGLLYKANDEERVAIRKDWNKAKGIVIIENNSVNELYSQDVVTILESESFDEARDNVIKIKYKRKDNRYTNFFRNFKYFYYQLSGNRGETWLNNFAKVFLNKCQIIEIRSWQIEQAITMFNSLNSTGMPLSDADIISAQLHSYSKDAALFSAKWKYIVETSNYLSLQNIVNIDSILQQAMYILRSERKEYKENEVTTPGVRRYYTYDHPELLKEPIVLCDLFEKILNIWQKIRSYPSIKLLLKFNENSKLFLISYLNRFDVNKITENEVLPIVECLLRLFVVKELVDSGYSSSKFKTFLFNENFKLVDSECSVASITPDFESHIKSSWSRDELKDLIFDYSKNALVYLNEYLYAKCKGAQFDFDSNVNIEHVMPSSGHNIEQIRIDAGLDDLEEFDEYANKLGNKILLEEDINKSIGNDWFRTKKGSPIFEKKGYLGSHFALAQSLSKYRKDLWKKEDIIIATEKAADRILDFVFYEKL